MLYLAYDTLFNGDHYTRFGKLYDANSAIEAIMLFKEDYGSFHREIVAIQIPEKYTEAEFVDYFYQLGESGKRIYEEIPSFRII